MIFNKILQTFILSVIIFPLLFSFTPLVFSQSQDESKLKSEIEFYEKELEKIKSAKATLSNQIAQFDAQIKLASLKIAQTEEKIGLLGGRITQLEGSLTTLTNAYTERVIYTYKMAKLQDPLFLMVTASDLSDVVSSFNYIKKIQKDDKDLLARLQKAQNTYKIEKVDQERLQVELESQKIAFNSQKNAKSALLAQTNNSEKNYQKLLAQAKSQLEALRRFVDSQGGASILENQTKCDSWGCYYNQRDSLWGNIGLGGSSYTVSDYGCLVSSVSMVASHFGKNIKPIDIAVNTSAFVPNTGYLYHSFSVNGINITLSVASKGLLDSELAAGRPVIAGLYNGPDHFIVILKKEGDNYMMHDPFVENGGNRPLTDKYNLSDITSLRLVNFN